jgi:hypothetical protein
MAVSRTIYTQGSVSISGSDLPLTFISGIESANFTADSPKADVNQQGLLGSVNKVQLEPSAARAEISCLVLPMNTGFLPILIASSLNANPTYYNIQISGIGYVQSGLLSAFSLEASVGQLPVLQMTFDGQSGVMPAAGALPTTNSTGTIAVTIPSNITGILYSGGASLCAQRVQLRWEMPTEKITCLGRDINSAFIFTRPPGTVTVTVDGTSIPVLVTGLSIGPYQFGLVNVREVSRTHNVAIDDASASYSLVEEGVAASLNIYEGYFILGGEDGNTLLTEDGNTLILD